MMGHTRAMPISLMALSMVLVSVIAFEFADWHSGTSTGNAVSGTATQIVDNPLVAADLPGQHEAWLGQTLARPLFSPDRRPIETGVRGLPRLTGIVVAGSQRIAIFASPPGQHPIIVETGGRVGTYQVQSIADAEVTVFGPQGATVVRPIFDAAQPVPALPPPRPPPGRPAAAK